MIFLGWKMFVICFICQWFQTYNLLFPFGIVEYDESTLFVNISF